MTYIEYVNKVLVRLREEQVMQVVGSDDNVVNLVAELVNDARRQVASAHTWNAYNTTWIQPTTISSDVVALSGAGKAAVIDSVYRADGQPVRLRQLSALRRLAAQGGVDNDPLYYSPNGLDGSGDLRLQLYPTPDAVINLTVNGFKQPTVLVSDDDVCLLPSQAVFSLAYALAAAERGEVGGQPTAELFALAQRDVSDAIALDASLNTLDDVWYS